MYEKAADEFRITMTLAPQLPITYLNLGTALRDAGHYDQAEEILRRAEEKKFKGFSLHQELFTAAWLRSDVAGLERERAWMAQNEEDPLVVEAQANIDLLTGNLNRARQRTQHAVNMALESNLKEFAAEILLNQATAEVLFGEPMQSRRTVAAAMKLADSKEKKVNAAQVMALNGRGVEARQVIDRLVRESPSDTLLNGVDTPTVLAAAQLESGQADQALRTLEPVKPYEFGTHAGFLPNYIRGMAYLKLRKPTTLLPNLKPSWITEGLTDVNQMGAIPARTRSCLRTPGQHCQSKSVVSGLSHRLERRRSRYSPLAASQG